MQQLEQPTRLGEVAEHLLKRTLGDYRIDCSSVTRSLEDRFIAQLEMRAHWRGEIPKGLH